MKIINPKAEYWNQGLDMFEHVARCARVCYKSDATTKNEQLCDRLWSRGHRSMFRHWTFYYIIKDSSLLSETLRSAVDELSVSPYVGYRRSKRTVYLAANAQFVREHLNTFSALHEYNVPLKQFVSYAVGNDDVLSLVRFTLCCDTSIGISREFNRKSPNAIAEQSTRYVDFERKGGVRISRPWWYNEVSWFRRFFARSMWRAEAFFYSVARSFLMCLDPQAARGYLPLDTATRVVYTYSVAEWHDIMNLRYYGKTGKPHPDAVRLATLIKEQIDGRLRYYSDSARV